MKLFGEYLVEKKIINEETLAQALVTQIKGLPSIAEIVFENKLLKVRQFLDIIRQQNHRQCGFVEAASDLKLWQPDLSKEIDRRIQTLRIPLGEVLVKMGTVTMEQITRALDEFFGDGVHLKEDAAIVAAELITSPPSSSEYSTYCDLLRVELKERVVGAMSEVAANAPNKEALKLLCDELRRLKGAARLVGAEHSEKLLAKVEDTFCEIVKRKYSEFGSELKAKLPKAGSDSIDFLFMFKNAMEAGSTESALLSVAKTDSAFKEIIGCLDVIKFDFSFLGLEG